MMETTSEKQRELSDLEIIREVLNGHTAAYEQLMRKYNQQLFRVGISYLNHETDVEDAMQSTYLKAFHALSSFHHASKLSTWLIRIMINECLQLLRSQRPYQEIDLSAELPAMVVTSETGEEELIKQEMKLLLEKSIKALPPKYRSVYIQREVEELSTAETAEALNISESNVKIRLHRAKEMLREEIMRRSGDVEVFPFRSGRCDQMVKRVMSKIMRFN
jgi:RNA polymerase sigma factor (sigma-70 family)